MASCSERSAQDAVGSPMSMAKASNAAPLPHDVLFMSVLPYFPILSFISISNKYNKYMVK